MSTSSDEKTENQSKPTDYSKMTRIQLISLCKQHTLKGFSNKKKEDLIQLLLSSLKPIPNPITPTNPIKRSKPVIKTSKDDKIIRLNYIGSKYQLLDWLTETIKEKTGWSSFNQKRVGDLFSGTGIVSHHFRKLHSILSSNDAELYSSIITYAFTCSTYNMVCKNTILLLQSELVENRHRESNGYITRNYSPFEENERQFFTVENANRIDYLRHRIQELQPELSEKDYKFILASLIISADLVSNVPAVYGCYLKKFKSKALKELELKPIHQVVEESELKSNTFCSDVLKDDFIQLMECDMVYLDPPYNERQYSKNYFPLNMIAKTPNELENEQPLKGKTGIPMDCFISPFCKKGKTVEDAFDKLFRELKTQWIFLSYNSESIVKKEKILELMEKYGQATVVERDYKRFKSFEYNKDVNIKEYLFCLQKY
jgi:adenine-specific DNA-methyltransferase